MDPTWSVLEPEKIALWLAATYFLAANISYGLLLLFSWIQIQSKQKFRAEAERKIALLRNNPTQVPKISIIVPAFNESVVIDQSIRSFLDLDYGNYEVLVINDGSSDDTLATLERHFSLIRCETTRPLTGVRKKFTEYRSEEFSNLFVLDQANAGKAAALNLGISFSDADLVCCVDADTIPERDCLLRCVLPILERPSEVIAVGGALRVFNGCELVNGKVHKGRLPKLGLPGIQVVEYIRVFFGGRVGWEAIDATILISGAFTLFNRYALLAARGYNEGDITEDFEIILRMRAALTNGRRKCRVAMIPDPICWTQVPDNFSDLHRQRRRWQMGAVLTLRRFWYMIFNPRYGTVGMCVLPYMLLFEVLSPVFELLGYVAVAFQVYRGTLPWPTLIGLITLGIGFSVFVSMMSVYFEETYYAKRSPRKHFFWFLTMALAENFFYRQIQSLWRLEALYRSLKSDQRWGKQTRRSFARKQDYPQEGTDINKAA